MTDVRCAVDERTRRTRDHLETALERIDDEKGRYHVRQALQLLEGRTGRSE